MKGEVHFMIQSKFKDIVTSEEELRDLMGFPSDLVVRKQLAYLDEHCQNFIARSPFLLIGSVDASGACDVSPRGDAPGFVLVLDQKTLVIPERSGNRRLDTLRNVLQTSVVGLLFMIPGAEETLRVNGHAYLVRDTTLLERTTAQGKQPLIAIGVEVDECFLHCAKSLKRSKLWDTTSWSESTACPSLAQALFDQVRPANQTVEELEAYIEESYQKRLY